jgi:protein-tyrosine phosphatase
MGIVTSVVTAAAAMDNLSYDRSIRHLVYNLTDSKSENLSKHFGDFYALVEEEIPRTNILVHCFAGISRVYMRVCSLLRL